MKWARYLWPAFAVVVLAQLAVPVGMIARREATLRYGQPYKFRTKPVDPYDAFRGRYVALGLEPDSIAVATNAVYAHDTTVYVTLGTGPDGFAQFRTVDNALPATGDYLRLKVQWAYDGKLTFAMPFDRYYLEESLGPAAEEAYRQHSRREERDAYVIVRVREGQGVIEELFVAGKPIHELLRQPQ